MYDAIFLSQGIKGLGCGGMRMVCKLRYMALNNNSYDHYSCYSRGIDVGQVGAGISRVYSGERRSAGSSVLIPTGHHSILDYTGNMRRCIVSVEDMGVTSPQHGIIQILHPYHIGRRTYISTPKPQTPHLSTPIHPSQPR